MESIDLIAAKVRVCKLCDLSKGRNNAVPGEGVKSADLFIIGEAPGKNEDLAGKPFIGMAGRFLDKYLSMAGIERSDTFITNAVKCRPPNNRKPFGSEIEACRSYLLGQLTAVEPKLVLCLGTSACTSLGIEYKHLSDIRGRRLDVDFYGVKVKVFATFHPSFPMRFKTKRNTFLEDLKKVKIILG